jgi:hypothetical protein
MIRQISTKDKISLATYLAVKINIPLSEATVKAVRIIKSGLPSLMMESKDLQGICWVENKLVGEKKVKYVEILVNNWRLAENFIQVLRWKLNGEYFFSIPKHDFLNRTYNKNGIRFLKCDGDKNVYCQRFEKRDFYSFKSEDANEE